MSVTAGTTPSLLSRQSSMYELASRVNLCQRALRNSWSLVIVAHVFNSDAMTNRTDCGRLRDLQKNEIIFVRKQHESGWWTGQVCNDPAGEFVFPASFVTMLGRPVSIGSCTKANPDAGLAIGDALLVLDGDNQGGKPVTVYNSRTNCITTTAMESINIEESSRPYHRKETSWSETPVKTKPLTASNLRQLEATPEKSEIFAPAGKQISVYSAGYPTNRTWSQAPSTVASMRSWRWTRNEAGRLKSFSSLKTLSKSRNWRVVAPGGVRYRDVPQIGAVTQPVVVALCGEEVKGEQNATNWIWCENRLWLPIMLDSRVLLVRSAATSSPELNNASFTELSYEDLPEIQAFKLNVTPVKGGCENSRTAYRMMQVLNVPPDMTSEATWVINRMRQKFPGYFSQRDGELRKTVDSNFASLLFYHMGLVSIAVERWDVAVAMLTRAILKRSFKEAHYNLGFILQRQLKDMAGALNHFERAVQLDPYYVKALFYYGGILADEYGRFDEAISVFIRVVANNPALTVAHFALARLYQDVRRDTRSAMRHYQEAIKLEPYFVDARYNYALLCWQEGMEDQANLHFEICKQAGPKYYPVLLDLANFLHEERGDAAGAQYLYERLLRMQPDNEEAKYRLAKVLASSQPDRALQLLDNLRTSGADQSPEHERLREHCQSLLETGEEERNLNRSSRRHSETSATQQKQAASGCACVIL